MKLYEESLAVLEDVKEGIDEVIQNRLFEIETTLKKWRVEAESLAEEATRKMDHYISILERKLYRQKQKLKDMTVSSNTWMKTKKK